MTLQQLQSAVSSEYSQFCTFYHDIATTDVALLNEVEQYLSAHAGKQLRPLLVLLSAKAAFGKVEQKHIMTAAAVEMLHNATLMHDDVVDESDKRRGHESIRHRWGNSVAVLCGDYYLTQVLSLMRDIDEPALADLINQSVATMCKGELRQLSLLHSQNLSASEYLDVIGAKTATLMALCCRCGSYDFERHAFAPCSDALQDYGYNYGILFQIHDDINGCDSDHDVQLPHEQPPLQLLNHYADAARHSLGGVPDSQARQTLLDMLSPHAPQPRG